MPRPPKKLLAPQHEKVASQADGETPTNTAINHLPIRHFHIAALLTNGASLTSDMGLAYVDSDQTFNKEQAPCLPKILSRNCFVA
jgi:hypothetical protein